LEFRRRHIVITWNAASFRLRVAVALAVQALSELHVALGVDVVPATRSVAQSSSARLSSTHRTAAVLRLVATVIAVTRTRIVVRMGVVG
jgi:hypothetical protein